MERGRGGRRERGREGERDLEHIAPHTDNVVVAYKWFGTCMRVWVFERVRERAREREEAREGRTERNKQGDSASQQQNETETQKLYKETSKWKTGK